MSQPKALVGKIVINSYGKMYALKNDVLLI